MASVDEHVKELKRLVEIITDLKSKIPPDSGLYLTNVSKKLTGFQEEAEDLINQFTAGTQKTKKGHAEGETTGRTIIYISLFQTDPDDLKKWQSTVRRISEYSLARPIYRKPSHIEEMIRSRPDPRKEAYAEVSVLDSDIIRAYAGKSETDSRGHELLTVKEGAVKPANVRKFVHGNETYFFKEDKLVPASTDEDNA